MKSNSNKKKDTLNFDSINQDFIPYATHISPETILTKNLQLLQTIRINNFLNKELHHNRENLTLRQTIRNAIQKNIKSQDYAFWIHTVRRKVALHEVLKSTESYSNFLNKKWNEYNKFETQFINELYITIIIKGPEIKEKEVVKKHFTHAKLKNHFNEIFETKEKELTETVDKILNELSIYQPAKLKIVEREGKFYSENIEFFHKILNLIDVSHEISEADISNVLAISDLALQKNYINLENQIEKHSISVLTLKHYLETKLELMDKILCLPFEFIIYQAFDYININEVHDKYYNQYKILKVSKDKEFAEKLGLFDKEFEQFETNEESTFLKYGESQIGIIVISDSEEMLDKENGAIVEVLQDMGFVAIRDDVMIEEAFFSSLPGNFFFLKRMQPIQVSKIAGFASIDNYPVGRTNKNTWGDAVCLLKTKEGLPYFFNFHDSSNSGHTIFVGKQLDIQKNAIANFLIMQSLKFKPRIITIDFSENAKLFNAFLGGIYTKISLDKNENSFTINPFANKEKIENLIHNLLELKEDKSEKTIQYLNEKLIPFIKNHLNEISDFESLKNIIKNEKIVKTFFSLISESGSLNHFIKNEDEILNLKSGRCFQ